MPVVRGVKETARKQTTTTDVTWLKVASRNKPEDEMQSRIHDHDDDGEKANQIEEWKKWRFLFNKR